MGREPSKGARLMRRSESAVWLLLVLALLIAGSTIVSLARNRTISTTNSELYRQLNLFGEVLERVRSDYVEKPNDSKLIEAAINGMLTSLDPHSYYLNPRDVARNAGADERRVRRPRARGDDAGRCDQSRFSNRRHASGARRLTERRRDHLARQEASSAVLPSRRPLTRCEDRRGHRSR